MLTSNLALLLIQDDYQSLLLLIRFLQVRKNLIIYLFLSILYDYLFYIHLLEIDIYSGLVLSQVRLDMQPASIYACQKQNAVIIYYPGGVLQCYNANGSTFKYVSSYVFSKEERKLTITHMACDPNHAQMFICFAESNRPFSM